ncbi:hypothetical protein SLA2020_281670 [Shorea laevis]
MVSMRFTSFILMIMVLHVRDSIAHTKALGKEQLVTDDHIKRLPTAVRSQMNVDVEEEIDGGVASTAQVRTRLGGRKMMIEGAAQYCVGNCRRGGKGILNVSRKLRKSGPRAMDVKMAGFEAINADYHVPKPHPPKNN